VNTNGYDLICPKCASIQRKRLLWLYLHREFNIDKNKPVILDFSPNRNIMRRLKEKLGKNYHTTDYQNPRTDFQYDITNINCADEMYDLVICYHVLEHIDDDKKAMKELYRILKPGGILLSQVPFRENAATLEDAQINTPELREQHYGQDDHVRYYGKQDFIDRLETTGFKVNPTLYAKTFSAQEIEYFGLNEMEVIFVCIK
jgi:SAM-dependent methyltransferase